MKKVFAIFLFAALLLFGAFAIADDEMYPGIYPDTVGAGMSYGDMSVDIDLNGYNLLDSTGCANIGADYTPVASLATGSACIGEDASGYSLSVEGETFFESVINFGTANIRNSGNYLQLGANNGHRMLLTLDKSQDQAAILTVQPNGTSVEFTASSGTQYGIFTTAEIEQTGTAQFIHHYMGIDDTTSGSGQDYGLVIDWGRDATYEFAIQDDGEIDTSVWTVDYVLRPGSQALGPTAPSWETNDSCVGRGYDADAERSTLSFEVPSCWNGTSDLTLKIYWCPTSGDAPADTETVKWDAEWRSIDWGTEDVDNGTLATGTVTYTQVGAGDDKDSFEHEITIPYTGGNQPLASGDVISIQFDRDVSGDSYSGIGIVHLYEMSVDQTQLKCDHQN